MNLIKNILKKSGRYEEIKWKYKTRGKTTKRYIFENRMKNYKKVLFVLAGYKEFTYSIIFNRIKKFVPDDIEVCILSSGKYSNILSDIAEKNEWSYLSTKRNCVSLIQNTAITIFKNAKYIYKIDEDIFVTRNFFNTLFKTLNDCKKNGEYDPGFVAPLIPINGYGNVLVLKRFNCIDFYTKTFEKPKFIAGPQRMIENNPDVAMFMWGKGEKIPNIDEMDNILGKDKFSYSACPIRFSIGAILFEREIWEDMYMFDVKNGPCMGLDESCICSYCMNNSKAIIVSNNTLVGHLSFGKQNIKMEKYFEENKDIFDIHK